VSIRLRGGESGSADFADSPRAGDNGGGRARSTLGDVFGQSSRLNELLGMAIGAAVGGATGALTDLGAGDRLSATAAGA
jgi:uncharacterized membrane protein